MSDIVVRTQIIGQDAVDIVAMYTLDDKTRQGDDGYGAWWVNPPNDGEAVHLNPDKILADEPTEDQVADLLQKAKSKLT